MNLFFYSPRRPICPDGCSYRDCAERCLWMLRCRPALSALERLPYGTLFPLPQRAPLRNGDLIIVHIADLPELENLIDLGGALAHYRLVLIVSDRVYDGSRRYHLLNPRYIATTGQDAADLETVVNRIVQQADAESEPVRAVFH